MHASWNFAKDWRNLGKFFFRRLAWQFPVFPWQMTMYSIIMRCLHEMYGKMDGYTDVGSVLKSWCYTRKHITPCSCKPPINNDMPVLQKLVVTRGQWIDHRFLTGAVISLGQKLTTRGCLSVGWFLDYKSIFRNGVKSRARNNHLSFRTLTSYSKLGSVCQALIIL